MVAFSHIKLKQRRKFLNITQKEIADGLGVSVQQMQKYESGQSAISSDKIGKLADALGVCVSYFFSGLEEEQASYCAYANSDLARIITTYKKVKKKETKEKIISLLEIMAMEDEHRN